jgi:hypothetical protein
MSQCLAQRVTTEAGAGHANLVKCSRIERKVFGVKEEKGVMYCGVCVGARNGPGPEVRRVRRVDGGDDTRASVEGGPEAAERRPST